MGWDPLTREQAEERIVAWVADHLRAGTTTVDAADVPAWLRWDTSDIAFVVDLDVPDDVRTTLPATITAPRFDLPGEREGERSVVDAPVPTDALRLLVDIHTGEIAAAEQSEPVSHLLEVWRRAKSLDAGTPGRVPPYEE